MRFLRALLQCAFCFCVIAVFSGSAWGQNKASLRGTVTDQSGAVVLGAKVTLTNTGTGVARDATTGSDGSYLFDLVQVGTYKMAVDKPGFSTFLQDGIVLELNQNGRLDVALKIGPGKSNGRGHFKRRPGGYDRRRPRKSRESAHDQRSSAWLTATLFSSACSKLAFLRPDPDDSSGNPFLRQRPTFRVPDLPARRREQHRFSR